MPYYPNYSKNPRDHLPWVSLSNKKMMYNPIQFLCDN